MFLFYFLLFIIYFFLFFYNLNINLPSFSDSITCVTEYLSIFNKIVSGPIAMLGYLALAWILVNG